MAAAALAVCVHSAFSEDLSVGDSVLVAPVMMGLSGALLWLSWWPRTEIEPGGLRLYGVAKRRFISWADIEKVEIARAHFSSGDGIVIVVGGKSIACSVPAVGAYGQGGQYVREAFEDITAAWTAATGRTQRDIGTLT